MLSAVSSPPVVSFNGGVAQNKLNIYCTALFVLLSNCLRCDWDSFLGRIHEGVYWLYNGCSCMSLAPSVESLEFIANNTTVLRIFNGAAHFMFFNTAVRARHLTSSSHLTPYNIKEVIFGLTYQHSY